MAIILQLAGEFPSLVRTQGNEFFRQSKVKIKDGSPWNLEAVVQDAQEQKARLQRDGNEISARCSCSYFETDGFCSHLWAALLAADAENYLQGGAGGAGRLTLVADDAEEEDYDYFSEPEDEDEDEDWEEEEPVVKPLFPNPSAAPPQKKRSQNWRDQLAMLNPPVKEAAPALSEWPETRELIYVVDVAQTLQGHGLVLEIHHRERRKDGEWTKPKSQRIPRNIIPNLPDSVDREVLTLLAGGRDIAINNVFNTVAQAYDSIPSTYQLGGLLPKIVIPMIAGTGRGRLKLAEYGDVWLPFEWDGGAPYEFQLEIRHEQKPDQFVITGLLYRGEERLHLAAPILLIDDGLLFTREKAARFDAHGAFNWVSLMRRQETIVVPAAQRDELLGEVLKSPHLPKLSLPEELRYEEIAIEPRPHLKIREPEKSYWGPQKLRGELAFEYNGSVIDSHSLIRGVYKAAGRQFLRRNEEIEKAAAETLRELGWRLKTADVGFTAPHWELSPSKLPRVVRDLLISGWHVEAEGKVYRRPGKFNLDVTSGIDWFELHGKVDFDGQSANLPALLSALKRGESLVKLDDGTYGMLPEEWLGKYGLLAGLGQVEGNHLRFKKAQLGVLDALLASQPEADFDTAFAKARQELMRFEGVKSVDPPTGFAGELRPYQREGLGWMSFLQQFNFGGCLADCMGLGKTVQVLALLESRRQLRAGETKRRREGEKDSQSPRPPVPPSPLPPSLVVVPKSLVFNWHQEAIRFAPKLRVLEHTGQERGNVAEQLNDYDLILTTYGTMRNDAVDFKDIQFDYVILDEAQAIKNADTVSAKAVRLLKSNHRLALSGTPIENHLGELWSLFEFLNPGMLGSASIFKLTGTTARNPDEETRKLLSQALRPFILRRTKEQVAKDLPPKLEQTLFCELEPAQRKLYDQLREHYRNTLLGRIEREGIAKAKLQILEALLRLRQAACHPGLVDQARTKDPSAKLDMLLPQLLEVLDEGHKVLVFSQFTSFLAILREHLDKEEVVYEYLDGRTRDRQARVERFQTDPDCKLFLISLKAGGLGLNLTAAEYVFLLDPWWNPAVEAQAIDRAHRIGQVNQVFAYRIIARGTVEEKVLELQNTKRDLADAIISADNNVIRGLGKEDLELLLS
ncbi:MAG TPA: SNF2-related protein [Blastocatellia bacterium]|nr:SNF2-related protein [Blastocatellia bacterium]HMX27212.1 SNF2-related protein [Blastocatellia bacterium]HNG29841.1 SNF2-related protein [Blastocatellia bacterium]